MFNNGQQGDLIFSSIIIIVDHHIFFNNRVLLIIFFSINLYEWLLCLKKLESNGRHGKNIVPSLKSIIYHNQHHPTTVEFC